MGRMLASNHDEGFEKEEWRLFDPITLSLRSMTWPEQIGAIESLSLKVCVEAAPTGGEEAKKDLKTDKTEKRQYRDGSAAGSEGIDADRRSLTLDTRVPYFSLHTR